MSGTTERADHAPVAARDTPDHVTTAAPLGLIGLGEAGIAAAVRLHTAGVRLLAWDADPARRAAYAAAVRDYEMADADAIGRRCAIVLVLQRLGEDAVTVHDLVLASMAPGGLIIDMSPSLPGEMRHMAAELAGRGLRLVDALLLPADPPLVIAGGSEADLGLATPVLSVLGEVLQTGPVGTAQALSALLAELEIPLDRDTVLRQIRR